MLWLVCLLCCVTTPAPVTAPALMARTLRERGDLQYVFSAELVLSREGDRIAVQVTSTGSSG